MMGKERRWRKKERTGCRSVGDYRHKARVGATVNIRAISNDEDYHRHDDDCHHNVGNKGDGDEDVDETFQIMVIRMKWAMN